MIFSCAVRFSKTKFKIPDLSLPPCIFLFFYVLCLWFGCFCTFVFFFFFVTGIFWTFLCNLFKLLHLPPLTFHCVGGCWDRTQTVATLALAVRRSSYSARSHPHSAIDLIHHSARSHPNSARSYPHSARSHPHSAGSHPHSTRYHPHLAIL